MNKFISMLIQMLAIKLMEEKTWKIFKKTVKMVSNEKLSGSEKRELVSEMIKAEMNRLPNSIINLGIELAVNYLNFNKKQ